MGENQFDSDYIGHVMSFIVNWLLVANLWLGKNI
jgi:hypothetical protein